MKHYQSRKDPLWLVVAGLLTLWTALTALMIANLAWTTTDPLPAPVPAVQPRIEPTPPALPPGGADVDLTRYCGNGRFDASALHCPPLTA